MVDNNKVHGAKDEGKRPTVQSLRNRLRTEFESGKDAEPRPKKSWLKRKAEPDTARPALAANEKKEPPGGRRSWFNRTPKPAADAKVPLAGQEPVQPQKKSRKRWSLSPQTDASPNSAGTEIPGQMPPAATTSSDANPVTKQKTTQRKGSPGKWFPRDKASGPESPSHPKPDGKPANAAKSSKPASSAPQNKLENLLAIFMEGLKLPRPIIVASVISSILGLALPLAVLQIYDRILPNQTVDTLILLTIGLFAAFALDAILKVLRSYLLGWNAVRSGFDAQLTAVIGLLRAPHEKIEKEPPAIWVDGFEAVRELSAFEGGQSRLLTLDIPLAGIFLVVLGLVGGALILVPILLVLGFGTLAAIRGQQLKKVLTNRSEQDNRKHDFLVEVLTGVHTVKGLAMESMIMRRFERLQKSSAIASYETILLGNKLQSLGNLFANLMMVSVVSVGALMVMSGNLSIGGLACCSLLSGRLTQPVLRGIGMWTEFQNVQLAQERTDIFDGLDVEVHTPTATTYNITGAVSLNEVGFEYLGAKQKPALSGVTLDIQPGEFVGIKGEDGSGRSTLVKLITGELKPTTGSVIIGGLESCPNREQLQVNDVAYVSANSATFNGTILENISMFRSGSAIEAAQKAAKLIGLENDIHHLPDGYDTPLAQGVAHTLSSGFLQRVAIARALARSPKILIFDEANTMLDFRSDMALRQGFESLKGKMTAIIISNRPSFLAVADRAYALDDGTLTPFELKTQAQQHPDAAKPQSVPMQGSAA